MHTSGFIVVAAGAARVGPAFRPPTVDAHVDIGTGDGEMPLRDGSGP